MLDTTHLTFQYDVWGTQGSLDDASTPDDIRIEMQDRTTGATTIIGYMELIRFPSDMRLVNHWRVERGYSTVNAVQAEPEVGATIAEDLHLEMPNPTLPYVDSLKQNDLYILKNIYVTKSRRNKGYGSYMLSKLPLVLKRITNDRRPVVVVIPKETRSSDGLDRVKHFFEVNDFKNVHACAQTWYYC